MLKFQVLKLNKNIQITYFKKSTQKILLLFMIYNIKTKLKFKIQCLYLY